MVSELSLPSFLPKWHSLVWLIGSRKPQNVRRLCGWETSRRGSGTEHNLATQGMRKGNQENAFFLEQLKILEKNLKKIFYVVIDMGRRGNA